MVCKYEPALTYLEKISKKHFLLKNFAFILAGHFCRSSSVTIFLWYDWIERRLHRSVAAKLRLTPQHIYYAGRYAAGKPELMSQKSLLYYSLRFKTIKNNSSVGDQYYHLENGKIPILGHFLPYVLTLSKATAKNI